MASLQQSTRSRSQSVIETSAPRTLQRSNTVPMTTKDSKRGPVPQEIHYSTGKKRGATVVGDCLLVPPSPTSDNDSYRSSPDTISLRSFDSSTSTSSTSSVKSVRFSDSEDKIVPGNYSPYTPKCSPKSALRKPSAAAQVVSSLFGEDTPILAANDAVDGILHSLIASVKNFRCPDELDFSANIENPLLLAKNDQNRPFIDQLRKLSELRSKLAEIPTHGDKKLEKKHQAAGVAINRTLQKMKEQQLMLYERFMEASASEDLDRLQVALNKCVRSFKLPSELDFTLDPEDRDLPETEMNKPFINQLRQLDAFRVYLNQMPMADNEEWRRKHRDTHAAIGRAVQRMKLHQLKLHEKYTKACRLGRI